MSRIGKLPITIPENVDVNYLNSEITVKGKFGTLQLLHYFKSNLEVSFS